MKPNPRAALRGVAVLAVFVASLIGAATAHAEALTGTFSSRNEMQFRQASPCIEGQIIRVEGYVHFLFHFTLDADGGFHLKIHGNFAGAHGVEETTGTRYEAIETRVSTLNVVSAENSTVMFTTLFVSHGPDPDFLFHFLSHLTVNAKGEPTAAFSEFRVECKGSSA
jgi:hypothetical protein